MALTLVALVVLDVVMLTGGGFWSAIGELFATPTIVLLIYALLTAAALVHEVGHAAACRYGGAQPGEGGTDDDQPGHAQPSSRIAIIGQAFTASSSAARRPSSTSSCREPDPVSPRGIGPSSTATARSSRGAVTLSIGPRGRSVEVGASSGSDPSPS